MKYITSITASLWLTAAALAQLPAAYDLRDEGLAPDIQHQRRSSICWAIASCTAIQSNLMKKGISLTGSALYISPWHMAANSGNSKSLTYSSATGDYEWDDQSHNWGGDAYLSNLGYLTRGRGTWTLPDGIAGSTITSISGGPVDINADPRNQIPYDAWASHETFTPEVLPVISQRTALITKGLYNITRDNFDEQINAIKSAITNYGAVTTGIDVSKGNYAFGAQEYQGKNTIYYQHTSSRGGANHEVTIIGWDDNYVINGSAGAWIVQNSWGQPSGGGEGDLSGSGIFHVSYNDPVFADEATAFDMALTGRYSDTVLQNDPVFISSGAEEDWLMTEGLRAATLLELSDQPLGAIGLLGSTDDVINVSLYNAAGWGEGNWDIDPELALFSFEATFSEDGYILFEFGRAVTLTEGSQLLVILDYGDEATTFPYVSLGSREASEYAGLSFVFDGQNWVDMASISGNGGIYFLKGYVLIPEPGSCLLILCGTVFLFRRKTS